MLSPRFRPAPRTKQLNEQQYFHERPMLGASPAGRRESTCFFVGRDCEFKAGTSDIALALAHAQMQLQHINAYQSRCQIVGTPHAIPLFTLFCANWCLLASTFPLHHFWVLSHT